MKTRRARPAVTFVAVVLAVALLSACNGSDASPGAPATPLGSGSAPTSDLAARISAGGYHTCALDGDGVISCWGLGDYGQLGAGSVETDGGASPIDTPDGVTFAQVAAGNAHTCAIDTTGAVWCWGIDGDGTHEGENSESHGPQRVALPEGLQIVSLDGYYHSCATADDGSAWCWGRGEEGQLGDGSATDSLEPVEVSAPDGVTFAQIATGAFNTCALDGDGSVWCWGRGMGKVPARIDLPDGTRTSTLAAGFDHTCALTEEGAAWCWGEGTDGQLGDGNASSSAAPVAVEMPTGLAFTAIDAGNAHTCAIDTDGSVWCWGLGVQGGAADGASSDAPVEVAIDGAAPAIAISAGGFHSCALLDDGSAWCWGDNSSGQLGDGTKGGSSAPVRVVGLA